MLELSSTLLAPPYDGKELRPIFSVTNPYQEYRVDCQLLITANVKPTLVAQNLEQQLKTIYSFNLPAFKKIFLGYIG